MIAHALNIPGQEDPIAEMEVKQPKPLDQHCCALKAAKNQSMQAS